MSLLGHTVHTHSPLPLNPKYEWRVVDIPRGSSYSQAVQMLTEEAEYGKWELARSIRFIGGDRKVWLRRRKIRVEKTLIF